MFFMEYARFTKLNLDLIKNLPPVLQGELILFEDVIPDDIANAIYFHDPFYKKERHDFLNYRADLLQKIYQFRHKRRRLSENDNSITVDTNLNVEFIKKYPQFKQLIEGIEYWDKNLNVLKFVPIDQYLAEN